MRTIRFTLAASVLLVAVLVLAATAAAAKANLAATGLITGTGPYSLTVTNTGDVAAQLISRHWVIRDANDKVEEVKGLGVVGHQPLLKPGEQFEYTSGTALKTPQGSMSGAYFCVAEDGTKFEAPVPEFVLSLPRTLH